MVAVVVAAAVILALVVERRRPDPPTQGEWPVPRQLDRADFDRPDAPWLVAVFSSATCDSCATVLQKAAVLASADVVIHDVEVGAQGDLHQRYGIEAVPTIVVADAEGVVRASFVGPRRPPTCGRRWPRCASRDRRPNPNWASPITGVPVGRFGAVVPSERDHRRRRGALPRSRAHRQPRPPRPQGPPPGDLPGDALVAHHAPAVRRPLLVHLHLHLPGPRHPGRHPRRRHRRPLRPLLLRRPRHLEPLRHRRGRLHRQRHRVRLPAGQGRTSPGPSCP